MAELTEATLSKDKFKSLAVVVLSEESKPASLDDEVFLEVDEDEDVATTLDVVVCEIFFGGEGFEFFSSDFLLVNLVVGLATSIIGSLFYQNIIKSIRSHQKPVSLLVASLNHCQHL